MGHELVTRAELFTDQSDHPHAKEEYFKIQLGAVERLSTPIPAKKWKRLTFLYTTGERLLSAATIDSLGVHDEERQILWRALRERAQSDQIYGVQDLPKMAIAPEILAMLSLGFERSKPGDDISD